jgi:hypothetical protein
MKRTIVVLALALAFVLPVLAEDPVPAALDKKVGGALIDGIAKIFHDMAMTGSKADEKKIEEFLVSTMGEARKAKEQKQIDGVFLTRFQRILAVIKMVIAPDPGGILIPIIDQELRRFVTEVLGEEYKGTGPGAIGQVANAIADEMVNLKLYMDNVELKAKLRNEFDEMLRNAPQEKKK